MKLSSKLGRIVALLCIAQVCLLSLASVSPQIHAWVFHGGYCTANTHSDTHSTCGGLPHTSDGHESQEDMPGDEDGACPVVLFEEGVTAADDSMIQLPARLAVAARVRIESDRVRAKDFGGVAQARAPPLS